jgi:choline dehydrogenase-like flavoprotein
MQVDKIYKAIVVGSGAGGAPAAWTLAKQWGDGVAIVEAGKHFQAADFTQIESEMLPKLYAGGGLQATEDGSVSVLQGVAVGGSTVINDALCFRPPEELAQRWRAYGVPVDLKRLNGYADTVEAMLGVQPLAREQINRSNYLVGLGAARLGWKGERLRHNSPDCVQCGFRHFGCSYNAKRSMNLTFVPRAIEAGAELHAETKVSRVVRDGKLWRVETSRGVMLAEHVVLAAGVIQTPAILLRSGLEAGEGLQFHLSTVVWGDFEEPVDMFNGIPMAYGVLEFSDIYGHQGPGYLIEGVGNQPASFSVQPQAVDEFREEVIRRYRHLAAAIMVLRSRGRGRVRLVGERVAIDYPLEFEDAVRMEHFYQKGVELFLAAGAKRTLLSHRDHQWLAKPPASVSVGPGKQYLYTAHPFGGACRGDVTDSVGRVRGTENLWVLDASAFPEAPGANPQITIAALALEGAERILSG